IAGGTTFSIVKPTTQWLDSSGNTTALMDGNGGVAVGQEAAGAGFGLFLPQPTAVSSGNGKDLRAFITMGNAASPPSAASPGQAGDTSAVGATGGNCATNIIGGAKGGK